MAAERLELALSHPSDASRARTETDRLAAALGFDEVARAELAICASELAQNAVEHGGEGSLALEADEAARCLHLVQSDRGRGIDVAKAADRSRSSRGDGEGLASLGRLMDVVELSVGQGPGRRVRASRYLGHEPRAPKVVVVQRALPGEEVCGDGAFLHRAPGRLRLTVVDGLGHGPEAHAAATLAGRTLEKCSLAPLDKSLLEVHHALSATRGAAMSVVELELNQGQLSAVAVGNVRVLLHKSPTERWSPVGTEAVVGHGRPGRRGELPLRLERTPWARSALLCLFSDGLSASRLPSPHGAYRSDLVGLALSQFGAAAGTRDDATLLVAG